MNPLRRLLLGAGRFPGPLRAQLAREGVLLEEEGLLVSLTERDQRPPMARMREKEAFSAAMAVTRQRIVVWRRRGMLMNVPLDYPRPGAVEVAVERPDRLRFGFEASVFNKSRSGWLEIRVHTRQAARLAELLARRGGPWHVLPWLLEGP